jgi:hypothetical protein
MGINSAAFENSIPAWGENAQTNSWNPHVFVFKGFSLIQK